MDGMAGLMSQFEMLSKKKPSFSAVVAWTFALSLGSGVAHPKYYAVSLQRNFTNRNVRNFLNILRHDPPCFFPAYL